MYGQLDKPLVPDSCVENVDIIDPLIDTAEFPGGNDSLLCFIEENLDWNLINSVDTIGSFYVQFSIDSLGICKYLKTHRSLNNKLDEEYKRILNMSPKWKPANLSGKKITTSFTLPVKLPYMKKCKGN